MACCRRLDSCPPGISCRYTRPVGDRRPDSNGAYSTRTASQYGSRSSTARSCKPVGRSVKSVAATSADSGGWEVVPAIGALAASTASTPAADATR